MKTSFLSKIASVVPVIVAIVVIAGVMSGCQKEMEDETMSDLYVETVDDDYINKPIRLKRGTEKVLKEAKNGRRTVSSSNPSEQILYDPNKEYELYCKTTDLTSSRASFIFGVGQVFTGKWFDPGTTTIFGGGYFKPNGGYFQVNYFGLSPTQVILYEVEYH